MRRFVPVALVLAILATGCGSSSKKAAPTTAPATATRTPTPAAAVASPSPAPRTPTPAAASATRAAASPTRVTRDDALAQSLLLTTSQLPPPANWSEAPKDTSPSPLDRCDPGTFPGETGKAESGQFSRPGDQATLSESLAIFDAPASVVAALDGYPAVINCVTQTINAGQLDDADTVFTSATAARLPFTRIGDRTDAYRVTFHIRARRQSGPGSEGDAYVDLIIIQSGRAGVALQATNAFTPYDGATLLAAAARAEILVRQGLR